MWDHVWLFIDFLSFFFLLIMGNQEKLLLCLTISNFFFFRITVALTHSSCVCVLFFCFLWCIFDSLSHLRLKL